MIIIREATLEDYEALCNLYEEVDKLHREEYPDIFQEPLDLSRSKEYIENTLRNANKLLLVAEIGKNLVGFAETIVLESSSFPILKKRKWVHLDTICVSKKFQNKNIGTLLFEQIIKWTKKKEINRIELKVYEFNQKAMRFYLKKGFKPLLQTMYLNL